MREFHVLNLGAGVQSTTLYLMFLHGMIAPQLDAAIFADTQDEPGEVYKHLDWLDSLGGPRIIRTTIGKLSDALIAGENSTGQRWISIPAFTPSPDAGEKEARLRRQCSKEYKIIPIRRAIRRDVLGVQPRERVSRDVVVHQYIGISLDEAGRSARIRLAARPRYLTVNFPLIDKLLTRWHCEQMLAELFHLPHRCPKSACRYCPFHDDAEWLRIKSQPAEWAEAVKVDEALRSVAVTENRNRKNKQPMYLHRSLKPLVQIEFDSKPDPRKQQQWLTFNRECLGVCGV